MTRLFKHIGYEAEVHDALGADGKVRVFCGRTIKPLPVEKIAHLPTCGACALQAEMLENLAPSISTWVFRYPPAI